MQYNHYQYSLAKNRRKGVYLMKRTQPTHTVYSMDSLYDGVVKQAERYGDKERYIYKDKVTKTEAVVTYRDMLDHVNYISSALTSRSQRADVRCIR